MFKKKTRNSFYGWLWNLIALFIILFPISSLILGAIQTEASLLTDVRNPLPTEVTLQNFVVLITGNVSDTSYPTQAEGFPLAFLNSTIVSLSVTVLTLIFGSLSAYSLARLRFPGKNSYSFAVLATRMVPVIALVIPLFLSFRRFGLLNTLPGIIIAETGFLLPFVISLLRLDELDFKLAKFRRIASKLKVFIDPRDGYEDDCEQTSAGYDCSGRPIVWVIHLVLQSGNPLAGVLSSIE